MKFTEAELRQQDAQVRKVRDAVREGRQERPMSGPVDQYDVDNRAADILKARDPEVWRTVMRYHAFVWLEPSQLDKTIGMQKYIPSSLQGVVDQYGRPLANSNLYFERPHKFGQWRRDQPHWCPMAFTIEDLFGMFGYPEAFDRWIRQHETKLRMARQP